MNCLHALHDSAAFPDDEDKDRTEYTAASKLARILDMAIVLLMVAILITLSLPVCTAIAEQKAGEEDQQLQSASVRDRTANGPTASHRHSF